MDTIALSLRAPITRNQMTRGNGLETRQTLDHFLMSVEKRALRMATISTGSVDEALDIVQDAMMKLATSYGDRDQSQWGPLFHRILQNRITDWHRRGRLWSWFGHKNNGENRVSDDGNDDSLQQLPDPLQREPETQLQNNEALVRLEQAIQRLPLRQQQAFMLRLWEGLSVKQTAMAMGCSQGSVKTHYSRAVTVLRDCLEGYWP